MRPRAFFASLLAIVSVCAVGCGRAVSVTPPNSNNNQALANTNSLPADPLALLKPHLTALRTNWPTAVGKLLISVDYDVRKTDSLVSPCIATIIAREHIVMPQIEMDEWNDKRFTLAFQEGRWVLQTVEIRHVVDGEPQAWVVLAHAESVETSGQGDQQSQSVYDSWKDLLAIRDDTTEPPPTP